MCVHRAEVCLCASGVIGVYTELRCVFVPQVWDVYTQS